MGLLRKPGALPASEDGSVAIFSLNHRPIGKSTQARPNTAAAHIRYISRKKAASQSDGRGIPTDPKKAQRYFLEAEAADRKNGRVADKVMLALPKELTREQRAALVRRYAEDVTKGRAPWYAAIHDQGKDAHNPHCHLVIRDRDPETGKRVIGLSEKGSTNPLRQAWQTHANDALEQAGQAARIDHRSLAAQGKRRAPTIHEGPRSRAMKARGARPVSRRRQVRNQPRSRRARRWVDYPKIDKGRSRPEYNQQLESPAELWQAVDDDRQRRDLAQLARHQAPGLPERAPAAPSRKPFPAAPPAMDGPRPKLPSLTKALSQAPPVAPVRSLGPLKPGALLAPPDDWTRQRGRRR
jgi:hypothetical protein